MNYENLRSLISSSKKDKKEVVYELPNEINLYILKKMPSKKLKRKELYKETNFVISLSKPNQKEFNPNHLRLLIDLYMKKKSNPERAESLFDALEEVYNGEDPLKFKDTLLPLKFDWELENALTILCLTQLFMVEQDINYSKGKVQPPRAYLMGYIRMIRENAEEIDKLLWSSTAHPPRIAWWRNYKKHQFNPTKL